MGQFFVKYILGLGKVRISKFILTSPYKKPTKNLQTTKLVERHTFLFSQGTSSTGVLPAVHVEVT
jgi:hypothetical protein